MSETGDAHVTILRDFDSLLAQENYRQIAKDAVKYGAVMLTKPEKQKQLQQVLEIVKESETAVIQADELAKRGDAYGAWESVKEALVKLPNDTELNKRSAQFSSQVSEFVNALDRADKLESKKQVGSSLAWYLKARRLYPASRFAKDGINRTSELILPDENKDADILSAPKTTDNSDITSGLPRPTNVEK